MLSIPSIVGEKYDLVLENMFKNLVKIEDVTLEDTFAYNRNYELILESLMPIKGLKGLRFFHAANCLIYIIYSAFEV